MVEVEEGAHRVVLADERATARLAAALAPLLAPGDIVTLSGDLGSGKTTFAREVIRLLAADPDLDVPSPTFSIIQTYEAARGLVVHADLYRVGDVSELAEIGWDEAGATSILLVEWPERAGGELSGERLALRFELNPSDPNHSRYVTIEPYGRWPQRIQRALEIAGFLDAAGWSGARRIYRQGDASSRRYEQLIDHGRSAILMDSPRRPDGPAIRNGLPYSRIAKLAEDVVPFVAIASGLIRQGFSAPKILAQDLDRGLLLVEDLGHETMLIAGMHVPERMQVAADVLVELHVADLPRDLPVDDDLYTIPDYDLEALLVEAELLVDWYLPHIGRSISASTRAGFRELWRAVLAPVTEEAATWVLRDYHSPNLMWLPDRDGLRKVGLLDFQDAVIGHPAYDLVSLLQDARVDVPEQLEMSLLSRYIGDRLGLDPAFEPTQFARAYAVLGAQRATKILGIFVRLAGRDGKQGYLRHIPRIMAYLDRDLAHPAMADLRDWYLAALGSFDVKTS